MALCEKTDCLPHHQIVAPKLLPGWIGGAELEKRRPPELKKNGRGNTSRAEVCPSYETQPRLDHFGENIPEKGNRLRR